MAMVISAEMILTKTTTRPTKNQILLNEEDQDADANLASLHKIG